MAEPTYEYLITKLENVERERDEALLALHRVSATERLSRALHRAFNAKGLIHKLARIHNISFHRLDSLISLDERRASEYKLLKHYILTKAKKEEPRRFLIAVEYEFDDGRPEQGCGDAIMFDGTSLYVIEAKITKGDKKREEYVRRQVDRYTERLSSWLERGISVGLDPPYDIKIMKLVVREKNWSRWGSNPDLIDHGKQMT